MAYVPALNIQSQGPCSWDTLVLVFLRLFGGNEYLCVEVRGQPHESDLNVLWLPGVELDAATH